VRVREYPNGDLGVGDAADVLIRLKPGDTAYDWFRKALDDGTVEAETLGGNPEAATEPRAAIREHGELGPLLMDPKHDFTGPKDLK